jgi:hypothetical protein
MPTPGRLTLGHLLCVPRQRANTLHLSRHFGAARERLSEIDIGSVDAWGLRSEPPSGRLAPAACAPTPARAVATGALPLMRPLSAPREHQLHALALVLPALAR